MVKKPQDQVGEDERSAEETERIREATLKKLLSTPPKPFTPKHKGAATKREDKKDG